MSEELPPSPDWSVLAAAAESEPEPELQVPQFVAPEPEENRAVAHSYMEAAALELEAAGEDAVSKPEPEPEPEPAPAPKVRRRAEEPTPAAVQPDHDAVDIVLAALAYPSRNKNSASVRRVQYKLYHAGFTAVSSDVDGHYGAGTFSAVKDFQASKGLDQTGIVDATTLQTLFAGDTAVRLVL